MSSAINFASVSLKSLNRFCPIALAHCASTPSTAARCRSIDCKPRRLRNTRRLVLPFLACVRCSLGLPTARTIIRGLLGHVDAPGQTSRLSEIARVPSDLPVRSHRRVARLRLRNNEPFSPAADDMVRRRCSKDQSYEARTAAQLARDSPTGGLEVWEH